MTISTSTFVSEVVVVGDRRIIAHGDGSFSGPDFSPDGTELTYGTTDGAGDALSQAVVWNRLTGATTLVSATADGVAGNHQYGAFPTFSPDGQEVAFYSDATNLGPATGLQVYVKDLATGALTLVSTSADGGAHDDPIEGGAAEPARNGLTFTPDGTGIAFISAAADLVPGVSGDSSEQELYLKNLVTGAITLISSDSSGNPLGGLSFQASFSPDGTLAVFGTNAAVYLKNLITGQLTLLAGNSQGNGVQQATGPVFSPDGTAVVYGSNDDGAPFFQVMEKNLATGTVTILSKTAYGQDGNGYSFPVAFVDDGKVLLFTSSATNLTPQGNGNFLSLYALDLKSGVITLVSRNVGGGVPTAGSIIGTVSPDTAEIAYVVNPNGSNLADNQVALAPFRIGDSVAQAAIVSQPGAVTAATGGQLYFEDTGLTDRHTVTLTAAAGDFGTLTATLGRDSNATGTGLITWTYAVAQSFLADLITPTADSFTVALNDGHGGVTQQTVSVTLEPAGSVQITAVPGAAYYALYGPGGGFLGATGVSRGAGYSQTTYDDSSNAPYAVTLVQTPEAGVVETQYLDGAWNQQSAVIAQDFGGGASLVQDFDGAWNQTSAVLTTVWGATTEVQRFAAPGVQTGATLTTDEGGGVTVIQQFDGAGWNRTSAQIVQDHGGGSVETQAFDANWNQLSATLVTTYGTTVETQAFDGAWNQTGATIVSHSDADTTQTQTFDGAWNQIGAEIVTVSGDQTTDRHFDGAWALTGGSVTTALSTTVDRVDSYDSGWTLLTSLTEATVRGAVGPQVFAGTAGVATTYVFDPGDIDGDAFASFTGAAASASGHDVIQFDGYGAAAHLVQLSASHWEVVSPTHQSEIFTVIGAFNPSAGDVVFH